MTANDNTEGTGYVVQVFTPSTVMADLPGLSFQPERLFPHGYYRVGVHDQPLYVDPHDFHVLKIDTLARLEWFTLGPYNTFREAHAVARLAIDKNDGRVTGVRVRTEQEIEEECA